MPETWLVTVEGQAYGPYSLQQMQGFIAEGWLAAHSLVSPSNEATPHMASEDLILGPLFEPAEQPVAHPTAEPVGRHDTATDRHSPADHGPAKFGRGGDDVSGPSHFVILADMKSSSINGLEEAIFNLGHAYPLMPQMWLLTTEDLINAVRNTLVQKLGTLDMLFIVDTTHDKAAWFNFGPEADVRLRRFWQRIPTPDRKSA